MLNNGFKAPFMIISQGDRLWYLEDYRLDGHLGIAVPVPPKRIEVKVEDADHLSYLARCHMSFATVHQVMTVYAPETGGRFGWFTEIRTDETYLAPAYAIRQSLTKGIEVAEEDAMREQLSSLVDWFDCCGLKGGRICHY